jgi:1-acyl-sn-glycerol-3-phosphate acyltransferase
MGTEVFPDADLKIFLTASPEVRAQRRHRELLQKFPDISMTEQDVLQDIKERDVADTTRTISPLKQACDAVLIDTSHMTIQQVVDKIVHLKPKRKFPKMGFFYRIIYGLAKFFFKTIYRLKVYGLEHFPPGAAIVAANHASFYDPAVLSIACPEEVHFLARSTLFQVPGFNWLIRALNAHPVSRDASDTQTFRLLIDLLAQGKKVILFPEGKRSEDGRLLRLERGLSFLVQKGRCRVIPAYIAGTFDAWPRHRKFPRLFGGMKVAFGTPIEWDETEDKKAAQERITARTQEAIRNLKEWVEMGAVGTPP